MGNLSAWLHHTMVIERMTGVAVYIAVMLVAFSYIQKAENYRQVQRVFRVLIVALGLMAFFYVPGLSTDLHRWREMTYDWNRLSFSQFFNTYMRQGSTPSAYLLVFLTQKTGIKGLLPLTVCIVYYGAVFSIVRSEYKTGKVSSFALANAFLFFISAGGFLEVISGIRCFTAFAIIAWCIYKETVCDRRIIEDAVPYLIACTFHLAAIPVVGLRIVYLLIDNSREKGINISDCIVAAALCVAGAVFGRGYIKAAIEKGSTYLTNEMYGYTWEYIIGAICMAIVIITLVKFNEIENENSGRLKRLKGFSVLLAITDICFCFEYSIFHRFVMLSSVLAIPLICAVVDDQLEKKKSGYINAIRLLSALMLIVACTRGNLCGYKFFVLS